MVVQRGWARGRMKRKTPKPISTAAAPTLRYERVYMADERRIERSADQHDAIIAALARGDHAEAAQLLRENMASGLPDLTEAVEG
jgi:DNA-binding GntR family transcriptional regulator